MNVDVARNDASVSILWPGGYSFGLYALPMAAAAGQADDTVVAAVLRERLKQEI